MTEVISFSMWRAFHLNRVFVTIIPNILFQCVRACVCLHVVDLS